MIGTPKRAGFHTVTPYLMVEDVEPVVAFVKAAFHASERYRAGGAAGGTHVEVQIGDSMLMIGGNAPGSESVPASLFLYIDDVDAAYQSALAAGATSIIEPGENFQEERGAGVRDPFGNSWFMARHSPQSETYGHS